MLFRVGDKVKIKDNIKQGRYYNISNDQHDLITEDMMCMAGKIVTISQVFSKYHIEEFYNNWVEGMFDLSYNNGGTLTEFIKKCKKSIT